MRKKNPHVSETPATAWLRARGVPFTEYRYEYESHGGALQGAAELGLDPLAVVKTLVMEDQDAQPLVVLMHGNRKVSVKQLARELGVKSIQPCKPEVASRHSGYQVGGTSPFGTRQRMPVYMEASILELPHMAINGGRRGYLIGLPPRVCADLLAATPVHCALEL